MHHGSRALRLISPAHSLSGTFTQLQSSDHATQSSSKQGLQEGRLQGQDPAIWGQEAQEEKEGELLHLHLQGVEAGAPRHWCIQQGHVHHELVRQRSVREDRRRVFPSGPLQQEVNHHQQRNPDRRPSASAR